MIQPTRKLAVIMFTDIAEFTALSARDEEAAFQVLQRQRAMLRPIVKKHEDTWLREVGDGLLLTFPLVSSAVRCAIEMQQATQSIPDLRLRIGIHEGEITEYGGEVLGDDVNVAARIEVFAAPGGVAVSGKVQQDISSLPEFATRYLGQPQLKGVRQEVKVYCVTSHGLPVTDLSTVAAKLEPGERMGAVPLWRQPVARAYAAEDHDHGGGELGARVCQEAIATEPTGSGGITCPNKRDVKTSAGSINSTAYNLSFR